ncbi:DUF799 domain-containing protein [Pseudomonadota bacterium]|nr:DUF799 domain-containing protein [Pseudomonadota bacterium]
MILFALITLLSACKTKTTTPYDYSALQASMPRSILVIPPMNESIEVNAPYTFLSTISKPLAEKGYYVFPVAVIDKLMKENGLPTPAEMNSVPLDKLREQTGADAILYVNIKNWGQKYELITSKGVTHAELKLVDTKTGLTLWDATAYAEESSGDGGGGLAGMLLSAIISQVVGSLSDNTPRLSSAGNFQAINNSSYGLLNGPYKPVTIPQ